MKDCNALERVCEVKVDLVMDKVAATVKGGMGVAEIAAAGTEVVHPAAVGPVVV